MKTVLKTSLEHLPERHQQNLETIKEAIIDQVQPGMIILFGSYARGNYVEDTYEEDGIIYEYISDYDILIVTKKRLKGEQLRAVRKRIDRKHISIPTAIIDHTIDFLNEQIRDSHYFFVDLIKEGIMLYDIGEYELAAPERMRSEKKLAKKKEYFAYWMKKTENFYEGYGFYLQKGYYNEAAFSLHQAVESCYNTFSLVFTDYKPKTHELEELRKRSIKIHPAQKEVFPLKTEQEQDRFELLCKAYVDARYKKNYTITAEELQYLGKQGLLLIELTKKLSQEELRELETT